MMALAIASTAWAGDKNQSDKGQVYVVDTEASVIQWKGAKVSGEHYGKLSFKGGEIVVANEAIESATVKTDMTTITCEDMEGQWADKLVGHLKSPDFFNVEEHPEARFELTQFEKGEDGKYKISGNLVIKGISHPVSFPAEVKMTDAKLVAKAKVTFDRTKYDIRYGSGKFFEGLGDKMIYDEVSFDFALVAMAS